MLAVTPPVRTGKLIPLRTKLEVQAAEDTIDVLVIDILAKYTNTLMCDLRTSFPAVGEINLQHLRRAAKPEFLPERLRPKNLPSPFNIPAASITLENDINAAGGKAKPSVLVLLLSPASHLPLPALEKFLTTHPSTLELGSVPKIRSATVPLLPPATAEQAAQWSQQYWPCVYRNTNPLGPHPSVVSRSQEKIQGRAEEFIALAESVAVQTKKEGIGEAIGAVVVDPTGHAGNIAVIAGDARFRGCFSATGEEEQVARQENPFGHAVMRAIGMIAQKRLSSSHSITIQEEDARRNSRDETADAFLDTPVTALEKDYYEKGELAPNGYLCVGLDLYTTHEPCTMCSMAILHSRFSRVVFRREMRLTGGLCAESTEQKNNHISGDTSVGGTDRGYGMFWREELNWKLLAWRWEGRDDLEETLRLKGNVHA